ncbi:MAG: hypothetical protein GY801_41640 [bacterium]|nr:hypothetical protein [bacterium]
MESLVVVIFFLMVIGVPIYIVVRIYDEYFGKARYKRERIEGLRSVATRMNSSFSPEGYPGLFERLQDFYLFSQADSRKVTNVIQGTVNDIDVTIMDYKYTARIKSGKSSGIWEQTVILCDSHKLQLPSFTLRPENPGDMLQKIHSTFGYQDFNFGSHPSFSDHYVLQGSNEDEIRGIFNKNILSYYEMHLGVGTEGIGEQLLFYEPSKRVSPEDIHSFMEQGLHVVGLFHAAQQAWIEVLRRLEESKKHPGSLASLTADLASADWSKQFIARHPLAMLGGEVVEPLMALVQDNNPSLRATVIWVLKRVAEETTTHLARNAPHLVCSRCLVHFRAHRVRVHLSWWHETFTYYGCGACRQSREFFDWPGEIVAVLDQEMNDEQVQAEGVLRVNWLKRRSLSDFNRVEIIKSSDEQVERLAVQVGNDTDDFRSPHYKKMVCEIAPDCLLSENTLRILKRTFGEVQYQA